VSRDEGEDRPLEFPVEDVGVGAADAHRGGLHQDLLVPRRGHRSILDRQLALGTENDCAHFFLSAPDQSRRRRFAIGRSGIGRP
jgi:hypothetical protein